MGASLVEVDKIRPCRNSHGESAALRAAEAFDRLLQVHRRQMCSYFHDPIRFFPPLAMTSSGVFCIAPECLLCEGGVVPNQHASASFWCQNAGTCSFLVSIDNCPLLLFFFIYKLAYFGVI